MAKKCLSFHAAVKMVFDYQLVIKYAVAASRQPAPEVIMTNPGFCRNRYSDVVLVEARRQVMCGAGSDLEVEALRLVVEC